MTNAETLKLETLRRAYAGIDKIDPDGDGYKNLCGYLNNLDDEMLLIVAKSDIKFVSKLATNRCLRRNIV